MDETNTPMPEPQATPAPPAPDPGHNPFLKWFGLIALVLLLAFGAAVAIYLKQHTTKPQQTADNSQQPPAPNPNPNPTPASTEPLVSGMIDWHYPQQTYLPVVKDQNFQNGNNFYNLGTFKTGKYQGQALLSLTLPCAELCMPVTVHAVQGPEQTPVTILTKYSDPADNIDANVVDKSKFLFDSETTVPDLVFPNTITGPQPGQTLTLETRGGMFRTLYSYNVFNSTNLKFVYADPKVGNVYTTPDNPDAADSFYSYNAFYVKAPDWNVIEYKYIPYFVKDNGDTDVTWADGKKNTNQYVFTDRTGCGGSNEASVMPASKINIQNDLKTAGHTSQGDIVYELKDSNNQIVKDIYDNQYNPYNGPKLTYTQFLAKHPVFFWVDPFGRLLKFANNDFQPQAECAKPVIYLYPQKTEKVSVKLAPVGGFKYSEPTYGNGWNVVAGPDGTLTVGDKTYPYLFWEGWGGLYQTPDKGFVVAQTDVDSFLNEKLAALGLNPKEAADFKEYWEPYMTGSPYYFITFMGNSVMDNIAPMNVQPKPDTVIRILMDFQPLEKPVPVQGYDIKTPVRRGFTVVEWGGVKH